jgi:hypothetical protein
MICTTQMEFKITYIAALYDGVPDNSETSSA